MAGDGDGVADGDDGEEAAVGKNFQDLASGEGGEGEGSDHLLDAHLVPAAGAEIWGFDDGEGAEGVAGHDPVAVGKDLDVEQRKVEPAFLKAAVEEFLDAARGQGPVIIMMHGSSL